MQRRIASGLMFLVLLSFFGSCKTRRAIEQSPLVNLNGNVILEQIEANTFKFETLSGKLSANVETATMNGSFKINLRSAHDSTLWMSLTPALGIEAARVLIQHDTLQYLNKLKKQSFSGNFDAIDTVLYYHTGYNFIENLLVGNPVDIQPGEKYSAGVEDLYYVIQTKVKRKVRKAMDVRLKKASDDTLSMEVVKEKQFNKATEKYGDEDLILKRYFVRADDFRVVKAYIDDLLYKRAIRIEYADFMDVNGTSFPHTINIEVSTPTESAKFKLQYSRVKINEPQTYPFKIPSSYSPIR